MQYGPMYETFPGVLSLEIPFVSDCGATGWIRKSVSLTFLSLMVCGRKVYNTDAQLPPDTDEMYCDGLRMGCPFGNVIPFNADSCPNAHVNARDPPPERHIPRTGCVAPLWVTAGYKFAIYCWAMRSPLVLRKFADPEVITSVERFPDHNRRATDAVPETPSDRRRNRRLPRSSFRRGVYSGQDAEL
jgi:hypothetical protein